MTARGVLWCVSAALCCGLPTGAEQALTVPSGQPVSLLERLVDTQDPDDAATWRYRFVAPRIARDLSDRVDYALAAEDFTALCDGFVLKDIAAAPDSPPDRVVITLMDRPIPFGQPAPEATQFIEAFAVSTGTCEWEAF